MTSTFCAWIYLLHIIYLACFYEPSVSQMRLTNGQLRNLKKYISQLKKPKALMFPLKVLRFQSIVSYITML